MIDLALPPVPSPDPAAAPDARPVLPPPPEPGPAGRAVGDAAGRALRVVNAGIAVPLLRAGLGAWLGTPVGGWLLLLRVRGRKSGLVRETPLSYLVAEGSAWVMAGFGPRTQWYRNLLADPGVEVLLPGRAVLCVAVDVVDPDTRRRIIPLLVRATGVPGYLTGCDPYRSPPERVLESTAWIPLIRLRPVGEPLVAGPDDPGGRGWAWRQPIVIAVTLWLTRRALRLVRRAGERVR